jgi:hypothetical protein
MAEEVKEVKKDEDWMQKKWRPAMGWMYMVVCFCDMVLFPVAWSILQAVLKQPVTQWNPLTLQGAGLFHLAMGAVLGIAAWGRTQEKVAGAASNATPNLPTGVSPTSSLPTTTAMPVSTTTTYNYVPTPVVSAQPSVGFGGKLAPPPAPQPEI